MNAKEILSLIDKSMIIREEYNSSLVRYKTRNGKRIKSLIPIYKNPNKNDYNEIIKEGGSDHNTVKFIATYKDKSIYVWDAYYAIHDEVANHLQLGSYGNWTNDSEVFSGTATLTKGVATMTTTDRFDVIRDARAAIKAGEVPWVVQSLMTQLNLDWSWLDKYVICSKYLKDMKSKFRGLLSKL